MMTNDQPQPYELEISVFGKGLGECIAVHYGDGNWAIVDSFIEDKLKEPIALQYLSNIGVEAKTAVRFVIATHWHSDHIRGLPALVDYCDAAQFVCSPAYRAKPFRLMIEAYKTNGFLDDAKLRDLYDTFKILAERKLRTGTGVLKSAVENLRIIRYDLACGIEAEIWALSPSSARQQQALLEIASLFDDSGADLPLAPLQNENDLSVAAWVRVGSAISLLGADLEENGNPDEGWSAVVASQARPPEPGSNYKVSHHGSITGHHDEIWSTLLTDSPVVAVTPFSRLRNPLPKKRDAERILSFTSEAYLASRPRFRQGEKLSGTTRKIVAHIRRERPIYELGHVRMRADGRAANPVWSVETSGAANLLSKEVSQLFE
jgi:hypothetical protein